jgi:hypothetical protein
MGCSDCLAPKWLRTPLEARRWQGSSIIVASGPCICVVTETPAIPFSPVSTATCNVPETTSLRHLNSLFKPQDIGSLNHQCVSQDLPVLAHRCFISHKGNLEAT